MTIMGIIALFFLEIELKMFRIRLFFKIVMPVKLNINYTKQFKK